VSPSGTNRRGIVAMTASMGLFIAGDSVAKTVGQLYPPGEVLFFRTVMILAFLVVLLIVSGQFKSFSSAWRGKTLLRAGFDGFASATYLVTLVHLPLSTLAAIILTVPLMITAFSVALFGEQVGWRRWTAIAIGLLGALIAIKPAPSEFNAWALLGFASAIATTGRDLTTSRIDQSVPSFLVTFVGATAILLAGAALGATEQWRLFTDRDFLTLAAGAALHCTAMICLVIASRNGKVSLVAPFRYVFLLWAAIAGYFVFGELPDKWSILGSALIVGSGLYTLHRERVRGRQVATTLADPL
jgi:drug/metabolite transporter (DMT)-like permease